MEECEDRRLLTVDLAVASFVATGGTHLQVGYQVLGAAGEVGPEFGITVFRSSNGIDLDAPLTSIQITDPAELVTGSHWATWIPDFADVNQDYYLVAKVDGENLITEPNEGNNQTGITSIGRTEFITASGVVHIHGISGPEQISLDDHDGFIWTGKNAFDNSVVTDIRVRLHDGGDTLALNARVNAPLLALGGGGEDNITGGSANDLILGGIGNDILRGGPGHDQLYGEVGTDALYGDAGDDSLFGGAGNDIAYFVNAVNESLGADVLTEAAAEGIDSLNFVGFSKGVALDLALTTQQLLDDPTSPLLRLTLQNPEQFEDIYGTNYNDTLIGNGRGNYIHAFGGSDILEGRAGGDILRGAGGNDNFVFKGSADLGADVIREDDNSAIDSLNFVDLLQGVSVDLGSIAQQTLNPLVKVTLESTLGQAIEEVYGSNLNDTLTGNDRDNYLHGFGGNDVLEGKAGNDTLRGAGGNDLYYFRGTTALGNDSILEDNDADIDSISFVGMGQAVALNIGVTGAQSVNSLLTLNLNNLRSIEDIYGTNYADIVSGNDRNNYILGYGGNDIIDGKAGNDNVRGAGGDDILSGGDGNDIMDDGLGNDIVNGGAGVDTYIKGGEAGDVYSDPDQTP